MKYVVGTQSDDSVSERERQHRQLAYEAACEGIVLLENDGTLPLKKGNIALYGSGAVNTVKGGTGSGEVNERYSVNIRDGLVNAGFTVTSDNWLNDYDGELRQALETYDKKCTELADQAKDLTALMDVTNYPFIYPLGRNITEDDVIESKTDVAIYVVARQAGENGDKKLDNGDFSLFEQEIEHIRFLSEHYKKTVLVINSGSQMDLSMIDEFHLSAIIWYCQQGEEGGNALGDIICGNITPSGKLSDTWVNSYDDIPFGKEYSYLSSDPLKEYYHEGIYVGYRYFDSFGIEPRYPFGYGLSYTQFDMCIKDIKTERTEVTVLTEVTNTGNYQGKEILQLYVSAPQGKLDKEFRRLVAFGKTGSLNPGEREELALQFDIRDCSSFDEENSAYILEKGDYILRVGNSSAENKPCFVIRLDNTVTVSEVKHVCRNKDTFEELHAVRQKEEHNLPVYEINADVIVTQKAVYAQQEAEQREDIRKIIAPLKEKQLLKICLGTGIIGMFDGTGVVTPGAVGRTTGDFMKKGLINVNLADGPAGLRIMRRSAIRNGRVRMADYLIGFMKYLPSFVKKWIMVDPEKEQLGYQFATAFPVATSLAQSWNTELIERIGKAISLEMDEFNVTYWLGPAMNIHRNPLCGRNFEYYSEDPVLSGKIAAAIVRGVQSIKGNYATVKHFVCNNQEENRYFSDSILSERTLREIYFKAFEICVKEAHPAAVMSSYNKVNGIYVAESHELLSDVLRCEWGFDGVVMTDWNSTKEGQADSAMAIKAGNDLIMPGGYSYSKALKKSLKKGKLKKEDLYLSASRVVKQVMNSNVSMKYRKEFFR